MWRLNFKEATKCCNGVSINECYNAAKPFWQEVVSFANKIPSLIVAGTKIEFGEASRYTPLKPSSLHRITSPHNNHPPYRNIPNVWKDLYYWSRKHLSRRYDIKIYDTSTKSESSAIVANAYCVWYWYDKNCNV